MRFSCGMRQHVVNGCCLFFVHVGDFAHLDVSRAFRSVVNWVALGAKDVLGVVVVAEP